MTDGAHGVTASQIKNLIWWTVNFLVLMLLLYRLLKRPIVNFFINRQEGLKREYEELLQKKREAEAKYLELQEKVKNLKSEAEQIYQNYVEQGMKERDRIIEEARKQAERLREQAQLYIAQEMEKAKEMLRVELADEAVKLAEEMLKKRVSPEDQRLLFKDFVENIKGRMVN
ncbi:MAG: F0F1 ATP synthase subunit B [Caldimicrobium sp.]|nr:F0F1 ATP synthase subunit B [Caldimicrobium sp.]MCX7613664.1 F0F1 ATP synthase subunit B [Caldimicrobium sp.]MDW8182711.1 F0F1 ATP synthase subunit B [Caldimicrobium sp.]